MWCSKALGNSRLYSSTYTRAYCDLTRVTCLYRVHLEEGGLQNWLLAREAAAKEGVDARHASLPRRASGLLDDGVEPAQ